MEVVLNQDVEKLGYKGDLVRVRDGFGRNYLIPRGLATLATPPVKKMHEENKRQQAYRLEKIKEEARKAAEALKGMAVKIGVKVGDQGKIFGSVGSNHLVEALQKLGYTIDKSNITLKKETIKETGTYEAVIEFHREVKETIRFEVVEE